MKVANLLHKKETRKNKLMQMGVFPENCILFIASLFSLILVFHLREVNGVATYCTYALYQCRIKESLRLEKTFKIKIKSKC